MAVKQPRREEKICTDECLSINSGEWLRAGLLEQGSSQTWSWWDARGSLSASIGVLGVRGGVVLRYSTRGTLITYRVGLTSTPVVGGGIRWWFVCPVCRRRCGLLYLPQIGNGLLFACRVCHKLVYRSQRLSADERLRKSARTIRNRLGGSNAPCFAFADKPKGMHWETYWRLMDEAELAELRAERMIIAQYRVQPVSLDR